MKFRFLRHISFVIVLSAFFVLPSEAAARPGINVLLYENGKKITDNSVIATGNSRDKICEQGCCNIETGFLYLNEKVRQKPDPVIFAKMPVRNVLSFVEWEDQRLLGIEGCEDVVMNSFAEMDDALSGWLKENAKWFDGLSREEKTKAMIEYMVSIGFTSYGELDGKCEHGWMKTMNTNYPIYFNKFIDNPKYTASIDIPYPDKPPTELYPLKLKCKYASLRECYNLSHDRTGVPREWRLVRATRSFYDMDERNWVKVDIATGTAELVTVEMRQEVQKMIDAELAYDEIMDRTCREDFLEDESSPVATDQQDSDIHPAATPSTPGVSQPFALLTAGTILLFLFTGTLLMVYRRR